MRPTPRGWFLLAVAFLLYFFANQTQVGWLYVCAALAAGAWLAAWPLPRRMLRGLSLSRRVNGALNPADLELHVGHPLAIDLELKNAGRTPALQIGGMETCPFALRADRAQPFFVESVPGRGRIMLHYETQCARRGWFEFPDIELITRAPFGFFSAKRTVSVPAGVLVFPEYRELMHLPLFDRMPATENRFARVGVGSEVVGVREYRPGDSRRHIHWRSSARAGRLIVKEFSEETQPGLTIALDLRAASIIGAEEDNSLELAVKVAATLARYANQRNLPVTLAANNAAWPAPPGPVSWWGLMNYLARVQGAGAESFADCLRDFPPATFVAALLPAPDEAVVGPLIELRQQGHGVLAVLIDPAPFILGADQLPSRVRALAGTLQTAGVNVRVLGGAGEWERALEEES